jgi:hypothetical protein
MIRSASDAEAPSIREGEDQVAFLLVGVFLLAGGFTFGRRLEAAPAWGEDILGWPMPTSAAASSAISLAASLQCSS